MQKRSKRQTRRCGSQQSDGQQVTKLSSRPHLSAIFNCHNSGTARQLLALCRATTDEFHGFNHEPSVHALRVACERKAHCAALVESSSTGGAMRCIVLRPGLSSPE